MGRFTVKLQETERQVLLLHVESIARIASYRVDAIVNALAILSTTGLEVSTRR